MKNKLLFLMIGMILLIGMGSVSAEKIAYSDNDLKVTLSDTILFGLIKTNDLGTFELKSHPSINYVKQVGLGNQVVMWYDFDFKELYTNGLGEITFTDLKTNRLVNRDYSYVYWGNESYEEPIYSCSNTLSKNGTKSNECSLIGSENKLRETWLPYNSKDIPKGNIRIGIMVDVQMDEKTDAIWDIGGKKIDKHAVYTSGAIQTFMDIGGLNYTILTYLNNGTFNASGMNLNVSVLVVAGGGGGGSTTAHSGGGGAGGMIFNNSYILPIGNYDIIVGIGGTVGTNGQNSSFGSLVVWGGGYGQTYGNTNPGGSGGSGGGGSTNFVGFGVGGAGTVGQGNRGGNGGTDGSTWATAGGGGGAGQMGGNATVTAGTNYGGNGTTSTIRNGTALWYAGGGGGGGTAVGGRGGGGATNVNGVANTGGGGGAGKGGGSGIVIIRYLTSDNKIVPNITLNSPIDYFNSSTNLINFNTSVIEYTSEAYIKNVSLIIDGILNETDTSQVNGTYIFTKTLSQGNHNWSILVYDNSSLYIQSDTRFFIVDYTSPSLEIISPSNTTYYLSMFETINNYTILLNWSINDTNKDKCWYSNNSGATNVSLTCLDNTTKFYLPIGNYNYVLWANDTFGNTNKSSVSFAIDYKIFQNSINYTSTVYETSKESYWINVSSNSSLTNAYLHFNGTRYTGVNQGSGIWNYTKVLSSSNIGNNSIIWELVYAGTFYNSSTNYQTISPIQFGLCNATLTVKYLNFTFKDEGSLNFIKASIPSSTFIYYLGDGTINKTYLYTNTTANLDYVFCALPSNQTYYIKTNVQYKNDTNYPQRIFDEVVKTFTNATTNKTLYLLNSAEGIYVTYQVLDAIGNQLSGVQVNVNRTIEGSPYNVGNGLTDSAGSITFWLNPDFIHSLSFSKTGYETFSLAQFPTQSAYTITLGTSTGLGINDYIRGITYTVLPYYGTILNVSQLYNFNMTFNSSYWTLDSFGFILYGDNVVIGGNYSTSSSGGYLENVLNVSSYTHVSIKIYWIINGTTIYGINNGWYTYDYEEGTEWSIFNFFKDLKKYAGEGIFGLNQNSLNLIIFLIIFLATGLVSYKFSLTSPAIVTGMVFGLVFLFDVGLGLISVPLGAVQHFPTIFMLLITVALSIWEMRR